MHELAIVQDLVKLCETNAKKNLASKVLKIQISVGKLSGVEIHYLQNAFEAYKEGTICSDATLIADIQDIEVRCADCGYEGGIEENSFICPSCGKAHLEVSKGEDLMLMRLEME